MPARRTQIYLTEDQRQRIDRLSESEGVSLAEVIRRALDAYLDDTGPDAATALAATFGAAPDIAAPSRNEWARG